MRFISIAPLLFVHINNPLHRKRSTGAHVDLPRHSSTARGLALLMTYLQSLVSSSHEPAARPLHALPLATFYWNLLLMRFHHQKPPKPPTATITPKSTTSSSFSPSFLSPSPSQLSSKVAKTQAATAAHIPALPTVHEHHLANPSRNYVARIQPIIALSSLGTRSL